MDNALIADIVIGVVLLLGAFIGAARGLFKSLMGLVVLVAALFGAVLLAGMLADPITDIVAPKIEDAAVRQFSEALGEKTADETDGDVLLPALSELSEALRGFGVPLEALDGALEALSEAVRSASGEAAKHAAEETFRGAVSASIRAMVRTTVHTALVLVFYLALLIVLKLLVRTLDHVFDLPVLSTLNGLGGALFGLLEAAVLLHVALYAASQLGVRAVTDRLHDAYLLPLFLNHSPISLISTLSGRLLSR